VLKAPGPSKGWTLKVLSLPKGWTLKVLSLPKDSRIRVCEKSVVRRRQSVFRFIDTRQMIPV